MQRIKSVTLALAILTPLLFVLELFQYSKSFRASSIQDKVLWIERKDRRASACVLTKYLADILKISSPVGVFSVTSTGVPTPEAPFVPSARVSALTKGAIVSKFLGYLYSERGMRIVESDYSLPELFWSDVFHFDFLLRSQRPMGASPDQKVLIAVISTVWTRPDSTLVTEGNRVKASYQTESEAMRRDLMTIIPPEGILVALKQADEALRQGRNTRAPGDESIATKV